MSAEMGNSETQNKIIGIPAVIPTGKSPREVDETASCGIFSHSMPAVRASLAILGTTYHKPSTDWDSDLDS